MGPPNRENRHGPQRAHTCNLRDGFLPKRVSLQYTCPFHVTQNYGHRYHIATGGADDTIRIFDIRALQPIQTIPAHKSNVSDLRFFHSSSPHADLNLLTRNHTSDLADTSSMEERYRSGLYFASAGYDGKVNIWSADDWQLIRSLTADADKVMSVDIAPDGELIASGSFSRNYQLFAAEGYSG